MLVKIKLDYPFSNDWTHGYLLTNREGRRIVYLYKYANNHIEVRKTISYARYLICVKEKRYLNDNEEVDHIDNDFTNDDLSNLQILSHSENVAKFLTIIRSRRQHGTYAMYNGGKCRCKLCCAANKEMQARYMAKHHEEILRRRREKYRRLKSMNNNRSFLL